jgi:hypothetical protein
MIYQVEVTKHGAHWRFNGELHREDGPAFEGSDGHRAWYIKGERHREDGPAIIYPKNSKAWFINGEDGPAIESVNGDNAWYIKGERLTEEQFNSRNAPKDITILELEKLLGYPIKIVK